MIVGNGLRNSPTDKKTPIHPNVKATIESVGPCNMIENTHLIFPRGPAEGCSKCGCWGGSSSQVVNSQIQKQNVTTVSSLPFARFALIVP
jgi:hypothetical protein